jgi:hypothetical protein
MYLMQTTTCSDAEIAKVIGTDEAFVKAVRQEFKEAQQAAS